MADGTSLISIGELSKPATVLIEKISDAVGGYFKPYQIRRTARAEADAEKTRAIAQLEISDLQRRAFGRFIAEEAKKQDNIESITVKALPGVRDDSDPNKMEDDWITNFFDKCRLISDEEMQTLWAKVLSGEANAPGKFSKRTVNYLSSLDKADAELFKSLCSFGCFYGEVYPLVYDPDLETYKNAGIRFATLKHLAEIGLITFDALAGFRLMDLPKRVRVFYYGAPIDLEFPADKGNSLDIGKALLSKVGQELAPVCEPKPADGFADFLVGQWAARSVVSSCSLDAHSAA